MRFPDYSMAAPKPVTTKFPNAISGIQQVSRSAAIYSCAKRGIRHDVVAINSDFVLPATGLSSNGVEPDTDRSAGAGQERGLLRVNHHQTHQGRHGASRYVQRWRNVLSVHGDAGS